MHGMHRIGWMTGVFLLALLCRSCGGQDGARATAEQFADALARGDPAAAQAVFGSPWDISNHMQNEIARYGPPESARVVQVETHGTTATAQLVWELERASIRTVWTLEQQGDRWVVTLPSLDATDRQVTPK